MPRRIPPQFQPGPLSRAQVDALNQLSRDFYSLFGGFTAAPPLEVSQGLDGVNYRLGPLAAGIDGIEVKEQDGSPDLFPITTLVFDQADGFSVSTPSAGVARIDFTAAITPFSGCRLTRTTNQTVTKNTNTVLLFDSEDYDTDSYHDLASNTGRLTIPTTGKYLVGVKVWWNTLPLFATGSNQAGDIAIRKNGAATGTASGWLDKATDVFPFNTQAIRQDMPPQVHALTAGDYLEVIVICQTTVNLDIIGGDMAGSFSAAVGGGWGLTPVFWIERVG